MLKEPYLSTALPLDQPSIRILKLHLIQTDLDEDVLSGDLQVARLHQDVAFTALSYVWAKAIGRPRTIVCSGTPVEVSENCFLALKHLWTISKPGTLSIWVDAICINQCDTPEKAQQIPLMGSIYADAQSIYVWLGQSSASTQRAMAYMTAKAALEVRQDEVTDASSTVITSFFRDRAWSNIWQILVENLMFQIKGVPHHHKNLESSATAQWFRSFTSHGTLFVSTDDLEELLANEWLRRMWTYQEILFANNPVIVCGNDALAWPDFAAKLAVLDSFSTVTVSLNLRSALSSWRKLILTRGRLRIKLQQTAPLREAVSNGAAESSMQSQQTTICRLSRIFFTIKFMVPVFFAPLMQLLLSPWHHIYNCHHLDSLLKRRYGHRPNGTLPALSKSEMTQTCLRNFAILCEGRDPCDSVGGPGCQFCQRSEYTTAILVITVVCLSYLVLNFEFRYLFR